MDEKFEPVEVIETATLAHPWVKPERRYTLAEIENAWLGACRTQDDGKQAASWRDLKQELDDSPYLKDGF